MSSAEELEELHGFLSRAQHVNVLVLSDSEDDEKPATIQRLQLHDDVAMDFREIVEGVVEKLYDDVDLKPYEPGYKPDKHELLWVNLSEVPDIDAIVADIARVGDAELFEADDDVIDGLKLYGVVVGGSGGLGRQAVFLRSYTPKKELTRRGGFALAMRAGAYNHVRSKVFLFDEQVDCFAWNGFLFIKNVVQFQRMFQYFEELRSKAEATVMSVSQRVPISNLDEFRAACTSDTRMMAKLAAIARKPYLSRIQMRDVRRTIEEFGLAIETRNEEGREMLVFDSSREGRWLILKLLDDDYLGSVMTSEKYEVNSKLRHR